MVQKRPKMAQSGQKKVKKLSKMVQIGPKWSKMVQNGPKFSKIAPNRPKWSEIVQNGPKWPKMVKNGPKWPKMVQNGPKMVQNGPKRLKWSKMDANETTAVKPETKPTKKSYHSRVCLCQKRRAQMVG